MAAPPDEIEIAVSRGVAPSGALALRERVFVGEQGVSPSEEHDGRDAEATHLVATLGGRTVGCARLRALEATAKVERVAVEATLRGHGLGRRLMEAIEAEARAQGLAEGVLNAQIDVVDFYERLGWERVGKTFVEAGIVHLRMEKRLGAGVTP